MPRSIPTAAIISHWHRLIENLETSSLEFYTAVEKAIEKRQVPDGKPSRIDWQEGGLLSAKREYLRVSRGRHSFDICAAPFGNSFFVSTWLGEPRPSPVLPTAAAVIGFMVAWNLIGSQLGMGVGLLVSVLAVVIGLGIVGVLLSESGKEVYIVVIPVVGWVFERLFRPLTYFRIDTTLMFQEAVHGAVLEVIDALTQAKGLRPLSELERKPVLREFYK
ncbi:MAG: hypothetical protein AAB417_00510 [Patescibacteria group bacterium]